MAHVICVISGKGGTGKSTFSANVALALSEIKKTVLLIDGDAGLRSLDMLLGVDEMVVYDWSDVLAERCSAEKALLFCEDNVRLLPAPLKIPEKLTDREFEKLVKAYENDYDYIIIDCPAGVSGLPLVYAKQAEQCIVIATPDEVSARSAYIAGAELIAAGKDESSLRLIINRFDPRAVKRKRLLNLDDMIDRTYLQLLGVVPEEERLRYASVTEKPLGSFSDAKTAFSNIAKRLDGKEISIFL